MGKKSGRNGNGDGAAKATATATAFVLKVAMHCRCNGCDDKIRAAVNDLTLNGGIEALDQSALWTKGELRVASTAEPDKLRRRLHKATGKKVDLLLPKPDAAKAAADKDATAAAMEALLRRSLLLLQQQQPAAAVQYGQVLPGWAALQPAGGYGYGAAPSAAYHPWAVQAQQPAAEAYAYPGAGGAAWGGYAAAYPAQGHGAYGGGWLGHGAY